MNKKRILLTTLLGLCLLPKISFAKDTWKKILTDDIYERYAGHNELILEDNTDVLIDIVDDSIQITYTYRTSSLLLNDHSKAGSWNSIYYSDFEVVDDLEAYSFVPNGKKYKRLLADDIQLVSSISSSVFYDESKRMDIIYPGIQKGTVTTLSYRKTFKDPYFLEDFFLQSFAPVCHASFSVKVNKDIGLERKLFNTDVLDLNYEESEKGNYRLYKWSAENIRESKKGANYTTLRHFIPHIKLYITKAQLAGKEKTYYGGLEELHRYYLTFIDDLDVTIDHELLALCQHLCEGKQTDWDKATAIYYWVQDNMKYVAYEHGYRGFFPDDPNAIFKKRYGDCKDMTSLLVAMLRAVDVEAYFAWVGTRHIPYTYQEMPTVSVDNHMVATVMYAQELYVLDGTLEHYPIGLLPHHIQGKQLFVSLNEEEYLLKDLPVTPINESRTNESINMRLDSTGQVLYGKSYKSYEGYCRYEVEAHFKGLKKEAAIQRKAERELAKGNNTFEVDSVSISNIAQRDSAIGLYYDFVLHNYSRTINQELFINMNLDKRILSMIPDTTYTDYPIENDFKYSDIITCSLELPPGYKVAYLPKNVEINHPKLSVTIEYGLVDGKVVSKAQYDYGFLVIRKNDYESWMQMMKQLKKALNQSVALVRE